MILYSRVKHYRGEELDPKILIMLSLNIPVIHYPRAQAANTRPAGRIRPSVSFYLARHLVSTWRQHEVLPYLLRSSYFIQSKNYIRPFEGNREADVAPGENEFDTSALVGHEQMNRQQSLFFSLNFYSVFC